MKQIDLKQNKINQLIQREFEVISKVLNIFSLYYRLMKTMTQIVPENTKMSGLSDKTIYLNSDFCPRCQNNLYINTKCFDCHKAIQWICYKCQWESEILNHEICHKPIVLSSQMVMTAKSKHSWRNELDDMYSWTLQRGAEASCLIQ